MALARTGRQPRPRGTDKRRVGMLLAVAVVSAVFALLLLARGDGGTTAGEITPVDSIYHEFAANHLHGLGFDQERDQLVIATHFGLFLLRPGQDHGGSWELFQLGDNRDDFMGFSLHPHEPDVLYTSGHPATGGNLGVLRSDDGGLTFERVFEGFDGHPIDFHSMVVSPANPDVLYGYYWGDRMLYRTFDAGVTWERVTPEGLPDGGPCWAAPCLAADPVDAQALYAGTEQGLMVSRDAGQTWNRLASAPDGPVAGTGAVESSAGLTIFAAAVAEGVVVSTDGGQAWEPRNAGLDLAPGELVFTFAFDRSNPGRVFLATTGQRIFESYDDGASWEAILR